MSERMNALLAGLPPAEPDPARADRIRRRCRARLAQARPQRSPSSAPWLRGRTTRLWQPLIALLGVAYLAAVIVQALRVYDLP